jgi:hypothetical protein
MQRECREVRYLESLGWWGVYSGSQGDCGGGRRRGRGQVESRELWLISRRHHIGSCGIREDSSRWVRKEVETGVVVLCSKGSPKWRFVLPD